MTASPRSRPSPVVARSDDGPVAGSFEVLSHRREGVYRELVLQAPDLAARARPGQFVEVAVDGAGTLLRRPFSIAEASAAGPGTGTVRIVYDVHGPGTRWLSRVAVHEHLDVVGPLGNGFDVPDEPTSLMLVAGGYGAAPMLWFAAELRQRGHRVDMVAGASTAERLLRPIDVKRAASSATLTTDDGSQGVRGRVTDVLAERMRAGGTRLAYAIGPMPMLHAVARLCVEEGVPSQVAVEEEMACGVGVCWTCVVPVRDGRGTDATVTNRRSCLDGPVFDGARVAWERTRWGSGGAAGAAGELRPAPAGGGAA